MTATSISDRLFIGAAPGASLALAASLTLAAVGSGLGTAAAAPSQPAPTDFGYPPPDPGAGLPPDLGKPADLGMPGSGLPGLSSIGGITPLIVDTSKLLSAGSDPNAMVTNAQSLLNDAGSRLGGPVGMPSLSSFVPSTGVPNVGAPVPALAPSTPLTAMAPPVPPIGPAL